MRAEYVWGSLGPVARIAGGRVQLYVCDALGYVRALIDAETGQITDRYRTAPRRGDAAYDWGSKLGIYLYAPSRLQ